MPQRPDLNDPAQLAYQLRTHSAEVSDSPARIELMRMADRVDGGVGPRAHHGCPDETIPTAECRECLILLDVEVSYGEREPSIFAIVDEPGRPD